MMKGIWWRRWCTYKWETGSLSSAHFSWVDVKLETETCKKQILILATKKLIFGYVFLPHWKHRSNSSHRQNLMLVKYVWGSMLMSVFSLKIVYLHQLTYIIQEKRLPKQNVGSFC